MSEIKSTNKSLLKYGWLIVLGCMIIQAIPFGIASNIQPQFVGYVVEGEGFSLGAFSLMFAVGTFAAAIASPMIGKAYTKLSAKLIFSVGAILSGGGIIILGFSHSLSAFYFGYAVCQIGTGAISAIGVPVMITAWFDEKAKGKALGIAFAGGSIGNVFLQPIAVKLLTTVGYSQAYIYFGIASLIVGFVVSVLLIRMPKGSHEMVKGKVSEKEEHKNTEESNWGYTFGEVKSIGAYWIFALGFIFIGIYVSALAMQYSAYLKSIDFEPAMLGIVGSTFAIFSLCGNLIGGALFDKFGMQKTMMIGFVLASVACISLILAPKVPQLAYLYGASKGLSVFAYIIGPSFLTGSLFGKKDFGAILAVTNIFFALGFAFGSSIFGTIVDNMGYTTGWYFILGCIIVGYTMLLVSIKSITKLNKSKKIA